MGVQNNGSNLTPRPRTGSTKVKPNVGIAILCCCK